MQRMRRRRRKNQAGGAEGVGVLRTAREIYFFQRHLGKFQFRTKLKSGKWKYAKNANEKKEEQRRSESAFSFFEKRLE